MAILHSCCLSTLYLSFSVHTDNAICWIMRRRDKNGVPTDAVHVDAGATLNVVQVDITIFGDQENNTMLLADLDTEEGQEKKI